MFKYTAKEINKIANINNFNKNTCEKVLRLFSVLNFIDNSDFRNSLALKGGTAINLFLLDLPRLSVDIDLDFNLPLEREEMVSYRENIDWHIRSFRGISQGNPLSQSRLHPIVLQKRIQAHWFLP